MLLIIIMTEKVTPRPEDAVQIEARLNRIQKSILAEGATMVALGALVMPFLYLAMAQPGPESEYNLKTLATVLAWSSSMLILSTTSILGAGVMYNRTTEHIREKRVLIKTAKEEGLQVSGVIFKRVKT